MHFVIAGKFDCPHFVHALIIAQRLKESLPKFTYLRICKASGDWEKWLLRMCKENDWYHTQSPIIWREISMVKGKKYYIGDVTKFLDMVRDHYGVPRITVLGSSFDRSEMEWFTRRLESEYFEEVSTKAQEHLAYRCRKICIMGAALHAADVLIMELLHIPLQNREHGMEIRLFDEQVREKKLSTMAADAKHCLGYSGLGCCRVVQNLRDALYQIDLLIVLDSFPRRNNESLVKWLKRNRNAMCVLGKGLNKYARTHCRVIIGGPSSQPICYNATVLASFATKLHVRNIVVVTQDLGRETLKMLSKTTKIPLKDLHCPPVWGFIGLNKFVDLRRTLQNFMYKVPGPHINLRLPQGKEELEIRTLDPMISDDDINLIFTSVSSQKVEASPRLGRLPQLSKMTAILDLLRVWGLGQEDGNGEILSLGVYSDGTFNIPEGLYWSQPVTLENGFWKPFAKYPIPRRTDINIQNLFLLSFASLIQTGIRIRKETEVSLPAKEKSSRKFDMSLLEAKVSAPVAKTRDTCLSRLKHLARLELGIDFDAPRYTDTISEESDTSTIKPRAEEVRYCECWRQELFQLRKTVFDRSSTTEVEVDLSENLSGSEWSVVNPPEPFVPSELSVSCEETETAESSSGTVVCDCGEDCHCLSAEGVFDAGREADADQIKDHSVTIYVDDEEPNGSEAKKSVTFDAGLAPCAGRKKRRHKLYGTKEAIIDDEKAKSARERIRRYERNWEKEEEGEEEGEEEEEKNRFLSFESVAFDLFPPRFHVSIEGGVEIVGDPDGLEALEEMRKSGQKESTESFTDMWTDEVTPNLQVFSDESRSTSTSIEVSRSRIAKPEGGDESEATDVAYDAGEYGEGGRYVVGEGIRSFDSNLEVILEGDDEEDAEEEPVAMSRVEEAEGTEARFGAKRRKRAGIPRCCMCHCIVPEGVLGCTCGETKVMEVFKKDSVEVLPESEGEVSIMIESPRSSKVSSQSENVSMPPSETTLEASAPELPEMPELPAEDVAERTKRDIFSLPPESFFPFSPKAANAFAASERPPEMRDATEEPTFKSYVPAACREHFQETEMLLQEELQREDEAKRMTDEEAEKYKTGKRGRLAEGYEFLIELDESERFVEKTFQSVFLKVENWRKTLMKKYREWFETGSKMRDDSYYEIATSEIADDEDDDDDELQINQDLKMYFEN